MQTKQKPIAVALNVAGVKVANVTRTARKPSAVKPSDEQMVAFCVAAFADYMGADDALQNVKLLWDAAREGLRIELKRAHKVIAAGKAWDSFLAKVRTALVKAKVCADVKDAGRLIRNQLIALSITGNGAKKGGKRAGAGRPEATETGTAETISEKMVAARLVAILAYVAEQQAKPSDDADVILGRVAALANGSK